MKHWFY